MKFTCLPQTTRWPNSSACDTQSRQGIANSRMDANRITSRDRLYNLFTQYRDYSQFNSESWVQNQTTAGVYDSLESLHDHIHGTVGGENFGYMSIIDVSAFDPI